MKALAKLRNYRHIANRLYPLIVLLVAATAIFFHFFTASISTFPRKVEISRISEEPTNAYEAKAQEGRWLIKYRLHRIHKDVNFRHPHI